MIERKGLLLYFEDEEVLEKLDTTFINVYYISKKEKYALIYFDKNRYNQVVSIVSKIEGILHYEDALTGVENYSFENK